MINESVNNSNMKKNIEFITYEEAIEQVKAEVDRVLSTSPLIIREYTKHLTQSRGKFIRAVALIMCSQDKNKNVHPNAVKIGAAIEILHLATLVHDDVIDNADIRRGQMTLWKKYGKKTAVICGDYLLATALKLASSISNKEEYLDFDLPDYMGKVCLGELNQYINNKNIDLSIYKYLKIISGKTAALFEASFYAGAIFSDCESREYNKYKQLGYYIGMIFQLTDDCIDFDTSIDVAKKPVQSDYEQGVITLPLIHAFKNLTDFKDKAATLDVTRDEINQAVITTGGLKFTHSMVKKYHNKSMKIIDSLELSDDKELKLVSVLNSASRLG